MMNSFTKNQGVKAYWEEALWYNAFNNYPVIKEEYRQGKTHFDPLPDIDGQYPALVLGSGPSLQKWLPYLSEWRGAIFCSPSQVQLLDQFKRHPEFLVVVDASHSQFTKLKPVEYYKTTLITHPMVDPELIKWWTWEKRYFIPNDMNDSFSFQTLPSVFPWITARVINSGCVANTCMLIAHAMGYYPIITLCVDMGFPDNVSRVVDFDWRAKGVYWHPKAQKIDPESLTEGGTPYIIENDVLTTNTNQFYKLIALGNWKATHMPWYDASRGILSEVPKVDFGDILKNQIEDKNGKRIKIKGLPKYPTKDEVAKRVDDYSIPQGAFMLSRNGYVVGLEFPEKLEQEKARALAQARYTGEILKHWKKAGEDSWERDTRDIVIPDIDEGTTPEYKPVEPSPKK